MNNPQLARAVKVALLSTVGLGATAAAQEETPPGDLEQIVVTGTRITMPGLVSSSPVYSIDESEIEFHQEPEVERILRLLPITSPGQQGENVNNGSAGIASINLRGLGDQRNLIMINGKRVTPVSIDGIIDTSTIPTALIERLDIVTGGASAVYGSDAISGAVNFIMKRDFEGIDVTSYYSQTEEGDGDKLSASITMGANSSDGRGNVVANLNWTDREGILMGARPLGLLGIVTETGGNYDAFLRGEGPEPAPAGCSGPGAVASGGSATSLPTSIIIAGSTDLGQFREDGTLQDDCSVFNFNPFNYYQTPQERFGGFVLGHYELNEHAEAYGQFAFSNTKVTSQVAPSGIFNSPFFTPLSNPFISDQALGVIIAGAQAGLANGTLNGPNVPDPDNPDDFLFHNWNDVNGNGVVDEADELNLGYQRRTVEFGPRSRAFDRSLFSFLAGLRGQLIGEWNYDVSFQYGESTSAFVDAGYTNLANIEHALNVVPGANGEPVCRTGGDLCVPLNLFGGFGSITPEMAAYSSGSAILKQNYEQIIYHASVNGTIEQVRLPSASLPLAASFGTEYREETGQTIPDECLKLAPASCLGGRGGNVLPVDGGFDVTEFFGEFILPLVSDRPGLQSLNLETGYRWSDYTPSGINRTWKYGVSWQPAESLLIRAMFQRAARAPNVGELASPFTRGLDNGVMDPCSIANAGNIDAELEARCISTGMSAAQVGTVPNIISGQINTFNGTNFDDLPEPEEADTTTIGFVWTPDFMDALGNPVISFDYYNIEIEDVIGEFTVQEILDACYEVGVESQCAKIGRVGGGLTLNASGVEQLTTNLLYLQAEGLELGYSFGLELGRYGGLTFSGTVNHYLTQESQSGPETPVIDCVGRFGTSCDPLPETRWINRTIWDINDQFQVSALWRHIGSITIEDVEREETFGAFRKVDAYNYIDLIGSWQMNDQIRLSLSINNVFGEDPPVVGNEAASTTFNGGNTLPSHYDTVGSVYTVGFNAQF